MEEKIYKGKWVTRSNIPNRKERLESHREFEASDLKRMLDEGWKPKRARIRRPKQVITVVFGRDVKLTLQEFNDRYRPLGFQVKLEIY